jgi:FkbM family methyltransferase
MKVSELAFRMSRSFPMATSVALRTFAPVLPLGHWALSQIIGELRLHVPLTGTLRNGMKVRLALGDYISDTIRKNGCYDPATVEAITSRVTKDTVFFDLGANVGQFSLFCAPLCKEVHAFEPVPFTFALLRRSVEMNRLVNVRVNQVALSDRNGTIEMFVAPTDNLGASSIQPHSEWRQSDGVTVPQQTLDSYCEEHGFPDVIKMDVEGAEGLLLRGAQQAFARKPVLFFELDDRHLNRFGSSTLVLVQNLERFGYRFYTMNGKSWSHPGGEVTLLNLMAH